MADTPIDTTGMPADAAARYVVMGSAPDWHARLASAVERAATEGGDG